MGWTGLRTSRPTREILLGELNWSNTDSSHRVVSIRTKGNVSYVALECSYTNPADTRCGHYILGLVVLHHRRKGDFTFKLITEDMGPCESNCPASILDLLSPIEAFAPMGTCSNDYATRWRARCREAIQCNQRTTPVGTVLRFQSPLTFTDGAKGNTFTLLKIGRRIRFRLAGSNNLYRITRWKEREFEILPESA